MNRKSLEWQVEKAPTPRARLPGYTAAQEAMTGHNTPACVRLGVPRQVAGRSLSGDEEASA